MSSESEWSRLRLRYATKSQYKNRKVIPHLEDIEDFIEFLLCNDCEEIPHKPNELIRYVHKGKIGIMWKNGSGDLMTHDFGLKFNHNISS